ncbi:CPBP family intramembrane metalloprotease [Alphaproteobacteria bacterium]|nr:CPBP family intramembrane metalloprotease [Alphaproteobacteria bacterium]
MDHQTMPDRWPALITDRTIVFMGLAFMFLPEVMKFIFHATGIIGQSTGSGSGISTAALTALVNLALLELIIRVKQRDAVSNAAIGTVMPASRRWFVSAILTYFGLVFLMGIITVLLQIQPSEELKDASRELITQNRTFISFAITFLSIVVIAPICEEVIFRGFLYGWLRQRFSMDVAVVISSLAFGFVHFQYLGLDRESVFIAMFFVCGLGFFAARLREKSGSLYPSIVLHGFSNLMVFWNLY